MLVQYDHAMKALSTALASKEVTVVLQSRADLNLIKMRARQLRDRALLADATEFQMRVERWLGQLLVEIKKSGHIVEGRRRKVDPNPDRITLEEIGVDLKLSSKAQRAAALNEEAFATAVAEMRSAISGGGAKVINASPGHKPRAATKSASLYDRLLLDGTRLGNVRLGTLKSRIKALASEARLLQMIYDHAGAASNDALATVASTVSEHVIQEIILGME